MFEAVKKEDANISESDCCKAVFTLAGQDYDGEDEGTENPSPSNQPDGPDPRRPGTRAEASRKGYLGHRWWRAPSLHIYEAPRQNSAGVEHSASDWAE